MVARNDITGDKIQTRDKLSEEGEKNWDSIFPPKQKAKYVPPPIPQWKPKLKPIASEPVQLELDFDEQRADTIGQNGNDGLHYE